MRQVADYLKKVTRLHAGQPKYNAMLAMVLQPFADLQVFLKNLPQQFDVDVAIGVQLDIVGIWVGRSRNISVPIPDPYFRWGEAKRGWGRGIWKGPFSTPAGIAALEDETFRLLIKAKISANAWDGTIGSAQAILEAFFIDWPNTFVFVEDNGDAPQQTNFFTWGDPSPLRGWGEGVWHDKGAELESLLATDMQMTIGVSGIIPSIVLLSILAQNLIPLKPVGVRLVVRVTSVNAAPVFGWGVNNQYVGGWGSGAWGVSPAQVANLSF
jgi:Protein of unknown function (DUF2612)